MRKDGRTTGGIAFNRQKMIMEYLEEHRQGTIEDFCSLLSVSPATIRRDLNELDSSGVLTRTYGGAILSVAKTEKDPTTIVQAQEFSKKLVKNVDEKEKIARTAASFVPDDSIIFVNSGSTTLKFIEKIKNKKITIVTNNASVINEVGNDFSASLLLLGGEYLSQSRSFVGSLAINAMKEIFSTYTFLGTNGLSSEYGLTTTVSQECVINQTMVDHTLGKIIVLADHTKIGVISNFISVTLSKVDIIITDGRADPAELERLRRRGISVIIVDD